MFAISKFSQLGLAVCLPFSKRANHVCGVRQMVAEMTKHFSPRLVTMESCSFYT